PLLFPHPPPPLLSTLSLHDALPIYFQCRAPFHRPAGAGALHAARLPDAAEAPARRRSFRPARRGGRQVEHRRQADGATAAFGKLDRKSTRLNSSHVKISYAVFCLKK